MTTWFDGWLKSGASAADARRLEGVTRPLAVGIAEGDGNAQYAIQDCLAAIAPRARSQFLDSPESLLIALQRQELDLLVMGVEFGAADPLALTGVALLEALAAVVPRVPVVLVHGPRLDAATRAALTALPSVQALVAREAADFGQTLMRAAGDALLAHEQARDAAIATFEGAEAALAAGDPVGAARGFIAAYRTACLAGPQRAELRPRLQGLLAAIAPTPALHAEALSVLAANARDHHDELHLIYHATRLQEDHPERAAEATAWLAAAEDLMGQVYALIDQRLDHALVQRRLRNFPGVLHESHAIQAKLANVLPSYLLQAEALVQLGRLEEAAEAFHHVADIALRNGELDRFFDALKQVLAIDLTGEHAERVAEKRRAVNRIEDALADPLTRPRYPCLRVCSRALCQEAGENAQGFFTVDAALDGACDVCDLGARGPVQALANKCITVVGGRLTREYARAFEDLGVGRVLLHDGRDEVEGVPALVQAADGVLLVTGFASHAGVIKAEAELARHPRPYTRVHFYGVKQVARALLLDLLPRL